MVELNATLPVLDLRELFFACTKATIIVIAQVLEQTQALIAYATSQKAQGLSSHNQINQQR